MSYALHYSTDTFFGFHFNDVDGRYSQRNLRKRRFVILISLSTESPKFVVHHSSFRRLIYKGLRISIEKGPFSCENSQNMLDYSAQRRILDLRPIFSVLLTSPSCIRPLSPPCTRVFLPWHSSPICACPSPAAQVWMFPSCQLGRLILAPFLTKLEFHARVILAR